MGLAIVFMLIGASLWFYTGKDRYVELGIVSALGSMVLAFVIGGIGWLIVYKII